MLGVAEVAAIGAVAEPTAAALSQFEELGAAELSQCGAEVTAIVAGIVATVSVRLRWAPLRLEPRRPGPTVAAATTPTVTTFAAGGTVRTEFVATASCHRLWRVRLTSPSGPITQRQPTPVQQALLLLAA